MLESFLDWLRQFNGLLIPLVVNLEWKGWTHVISVNGVKLKIKPLSLDWFILKEIYSFGIYHASIQPGDLVLDGGAHIGMFSLFCVKHGAKVVCFEPDSYNLKVLTDNLILNKTRCAVVPHALSTHNSTSTFYLAKNSANHSFYPYTKGARHVEVDCSDINDYLPCDTLKLDVEGAEYDLIDHADLSKVHKQLCIEFHLHVPRAQGRYLALVEKVENSGFIIDHVRRIGINGYLHAYKA